ADCAGDPPQLLRFWPFVSALMSGCTPRHFIRRTHKSRWSGNRWQMSVLPPKAAVQRTSVDVSEVPATDICTAANSTTIFFRINAGIFSPDGPPAQISRIRVSKNLAYGIIGPSTIIGRGTRCGRPAPSPENQGVNTMSRVYLAGMAAALITALTIPAA